MSILNIYRTMAEQMIDDANHKIRLSRSETSIKSNKIANPKKKQKRKMKQKSKRNNRR